MARLFITVGISGSGKTTWAKKYCSEHNALLIDTDDIREELWGDPADQQRPEVVFNLAYQRMNEALRIERDVVFCSTALTPRIRKDIIKEMDNPELHYKIAVYFPATLELASVQNHKRSRVVPEEVLEKQSHKIRKPSIDWPAYEPFDMICTYNYETGDFTSEGRF